MHFALADNMLLVCQHQPATPISALQALDLLSVTCPSHAPAAAGDDQVMLLIIQALCDPLMLLLLLVIL